MHFVIINGPNLNLLGVREQSIYGDQTFEQFLETLRKAFPDHQVDFFQSNVEGELINKLHEAGFTADGIILNAGAYTHTSVAIGDAVRGITSPVVEVHISNIYNRESFRHISYIAPNARGCIVGLGLKGYRLALESFLEK